MRRTEWRRGQTAPAADRCNSPGHARRERRARHCPGTCITVAGCPAHGPATGQDCPCELLPYTPTDSKDAPSLNHTAWNGISELPDTFNVSSGHRHTHSGKQHVCEFAEEMLAGDNPSRCQGRRDSRQSTHSSPFVPWPSASGSTVFCPLPRL
ncbi:hypothetical protein HPB50_021731 [Hyalomma asiaticum]|uniref:Uncharacterized protein n=1 Tax=Hyalomma asiaticum TaxID=266040 RepID=A0ACB7TP87_HYAAI|nr:hypothetical protein HPB50_021731 [Hyalomma asiaticum]